MQTHGLRYSLDPNKPVEILLPKGERHFSSNQGPQTWSLHCPYTEVVIGGKRGGGKSITLIAKPAMGDPSLPEDDPARYSFLNDKDYAALLLRDEYQSMAEFVEKAIEFYRPFGGKPAGDPKYIKFASGARIYFNHLGDEEAYNKYRGWNLTFIGIEELTRIPTLNRYLKLLGSLRSAARIRKGRDGKPKKFPGLRTQIMSTTNPDGPGQSWVMERFVYVKGKDGEIAPWNNPLRDTRTGDSRIFIPFGLEANPYYADTTAEGRHYRAKLLAQDEVTRKQWLDGDWNAGSTKFFSEYRPKGPIGDDEQKKYPWARHFVKPVPLKPWWFRWGSGDWGYDHPAAFHKFCRNEQDGRIHIYDELQVRNMDSFELGAVLARWWYPDLLALQKASQDPCIVIHMGKDVFDRDDATKTKAQRMEAGIKEILGPYGAMLLKYDEDEKEVMLRDPKRAKMMFERRRASLQGNICIALKPIYLERVTAWSYFREQIRFRPAIMQELQTPEGRSTYLSDVLREQGRTAYELEASAIQNLKPEILPKLQIWDCCVELDRCLKAAQKNTSADDDPSKASKREDVKKQNADAEGRNGDDALEGARNGVFAFKDIETMMPKSYFVNDQMTRIQEQFVQDFGTELKDPTRLAMIAQTQAAKYDKQAGNQTKSFNFPRPGSMRHRLQ